MLSPQSDGENLAPPQKRRRFVHDGKLSHLCLQFLSCLKTESALRGVKSAPALGQSWVEILPLRVSKAESYPLLPQGQPRAGLDMPSMG